MGGEIIAEKFALLKTRGSNGVSCTHIVEDTLLGQRAVVKISDKLEELGFDYLKAINLAREYSIPGLLVPFEGGILEEEAGYYLAFPELGEPSLENYLRMGAPITSSDILGIVEKILRVLESLHGAGFCHLFINTRNVFYRPRGEVILKDPALRQDFFHPLLELVDSPDFSYFSPEVMDGGMPGDETDLFAVGRLIERCLEQVDDSAGSCEETLVRWLMESCRAAGKGDGGPTAAEIRCELERKAAAAEQAVLEDSGSADRNSVRQEEIAEREGGVGSRPSQRGRRSIRMRGYGKSKKARTVLALILVLTLACAIAGIYIFTAGRDGVPALASGGGSVAGAEASRGVFLEMRGMQATRDEASGTGSTVDTQPASVAESAVDEGAASKQPASGGQQEVGAVDTPVAVTPTRPSLAAPVASFTLSPGEGQSPLQVYIDASASYDPDGSIVSYAWSCGGSGKSFYHVFESNIIPAVIPVTLTVTDDGGNSAQSTLYVTLY